MNLFKTRYVAYGFQFIFIIAMAVIIFESLIAPIHSSTPSNYDKLAHFAAYFVLALLGFLAYPKSKLWVIGAALFALGGGLEIAQELMNRGRDGSFADQLANGGGIVFALILIKIYTGLLKRPKS